MRNDNKDGSITVLALNKKSWKTQQPGGAEINLEATLKPIAENGHDVHVLVGSESKRPSTERDGLVTIHRAGPPNDFSSPLDIIVAYISVSIFFYWYMYKLSPDVVYTVNSPLPWPVVPFCPRIALYHHIAIESFYKTHPFPQNVIGSFVQRVGVFRDRNVPTVSVSPSTTEELIARGHDPETVYEIKNGLEIDKYGQGTKSDRPRILYIGGLEKYKGVDRIPEIHQAIDQIMDTPVHLDIAGRDGPVRKEIEKYCENTDNANFHGYVSEEEKITLLQRSWVFIAPSRVEGWGIAVLEANACYTPAVGSNVSGLRDSIRDGETGRLCDGSEPEEFAEEVATILELKSIRTEYEQKARKWAEKHSWTKSATELEKLFHEVIIE